MKRTKMRTFLAMSAAVAMLALAGCSSDADSPSGTSNGGGDDDNDAIVLGFINDTSGGASAYSPYASVGAQLAVDEINEAGGIEGSPLEIISESDGSDSTQTSTLTRRLVDDGADVIFFNSASGSAVAAKGVCVQEDILCVAPTNLSAEIIQEPDNENIYILGPTSSGIGDTFAKGMAAENFERLAIISDDIPTIQGYIPTLVGPILDEGLTEVANEKVPVDAADASAQVARIKKSDPDVILVMSLGGQVEAAVQNALSQQMPDVPRFSLASIGNQPTTWELADEGALEGLIFAGSFDIANNPRTQDFADALEKLDGEYTDLTAYGAQGYDSVYLVAEALKTAQGADDRSALNEAFQQISGYLPHYGQEDFTISYGADKHEGSDGNCGLVLVQFGEDNKPGEAWPSFQPSC